MHLVRKSLSFDKFFTATLKLVFPMPWPTIWVLASDYSKKHNRTTRYIRPHPASASRRSRSESRDIDVDEWGKNICKLFYSLAAFVVVPGLCYVLASRSHSHAPSATNKGSWCDNEEYSRLTEKHILELLRKNEENDLK